MGPFQALVESQTGQIADYLPGFFRRHTNLTKFRNVKMLDGGERSAYGNHPEAECLTKHIVVYDKFWKHDTKGRDWILSHELGHWALRAVGLSGIMGIVNLFGDLPFGNDSSEEAFADCFASYHLDREVQSKYPDWTTAVERVIKAN